MSKFIHLQNHSHFSLLEATTTIKELVNSAKEFEQPGIALTDNGVMYGIFDFNKQCRNNGIKPILGMDAYIAPESRFDKTPQKRRYHRIVLLAKNKLGYKNLMKLSSRGFTEGFYYKPRIDMELLKEYHQGLICLSGSMAGEVTRLITNSNLEEAKKVANEYHELFGDDYYLQIQNHKKQYDSIICEKVPVLAKELGINVVATNDTFYKVKEHAVPHNIHLYIKDGGKEEVDPENLRFGTSEFYIKSTEEMYNVLPDNHEALQKTMEIYDKCDITFDKKIYMPDFDIPESSPSNNYEEYLRELVYQGIDRKYDSLTDEIKERTEFELKVIEDMKFPSYFLVVWDFIRAAKEMNIRVGPGRGSAAGSIVAYALDITNVDPLKYDLLFERFLNPDRETMPDIDIDFADDKREKVIEYVKEKYGEDAVAMIITFGTLSTRAVLSDVGRVLQVPFSDVKEITAKIPVVRGKVTPLEEAMELPDLSFVKEKQKANPKINQLIEYSKVLENRKRNDSIHAAGVIITPKDVTDYVPISVPKKAENSSVKVATQFNMTELEEAGLLKMDFLGLKTLSIIENTLSMIKANYGEDIDIENIPLDDQKSYEIFSNNNALAIFQFESQGMQEWLKKLKPNSIEEITAMNALYRPGPMDNIGDFIDRKYGRKEIEYLHPAMENTLKTTYGIIVYQEQVMKLVQEISGFTLAQADILRRAMGKKKKDVMNQMKPKFVEGAKEIHDIDKRLADEIWDLIVKFADYGFNKSHSLAYSYVAYQTAWLKAHYPAEFLAANMTSELNDQDKIVSLIENAENMGISVYPPDINKSDAFFIAKNNTIYFGLAAVKGIGVSVVEKILETRDEDGPFKSFADFCKRVDTKVINRKSLEALICSGAFDSIEPKKRASMYMSIDLAIDYSRSVADEETNAMDSLFLGVGGEQTEFKLLEVDEWSDKQRLAKEKEFLNFYISGHPLNEYKLIVNSFNRVTFDQDVSEINTENITVCGFISNIETKLTKRNKPFAIVTLEDYYGKAECFVWSDRFDALRPLLEKDKVVLLSGKINPNEDSIKITTEEVLELDQALNQYAAGYKLWLDLNDQEAENKVDRLKSQYYDPETPPKQIYFNIFDNENDFKTCYVSKDFRIPLNLKTAVQLNKLFEGKVALILKSDNVQ